MQSKEMKSQNNAVYDEALISSEGLKETAKVDKEERTKMMQMYKTDIVGFLYELPVYLTPENRQESSQEIRLFGKLTDYLENGKYSFDTQDTILCLANEYGMAAEENGFRNGFAAAMKICMEGMKGGVC